MFNNFNFEITKIFKAAEKEMQSLRHPYVGSEHLLLAILKNDDNVTKLLNKYGVTYEVFKKELTDIVGLGRKSSDYILYTPLLKRVIENALEDAKEDNKGITTTSHLIISMIEESEGIAIRVLVSLDINLDNIYKELVRSKNKKSGDLTIMEIGTNLNKEVDNKEKVIGREKELNIIIETLLRKNKNNPLLVGKAGTGKTAIIEELARRINKRLVPLELQDKNIVMVDMASLVAGTKYRGEFEERLHKIINEIIEEKNIILFIDEVHTIVNAGGAEGAIDASNILKPYLARGKIKCIGATTIDEYNKFIAKDKALERRFQKINILENTEEETKEILKQVKGEYEKHHNIKITNKNIDDIVYYTNKYIYNKNNPDKCFDVLDSVCAKVKITNNKKLEIMKLQENLKQIEVKKQQCVVNQDYDKALKIKSYEEDLKKQINDLTKNKSDKITKKEILNVIENKTNIPLFENKTKINQQLSKTLKEKIIGQDKSINELLNAYKLYRRSNKPLSILLAGPTGVGKTYTVKTIAKCLKINLIRLDMSEYSESIAVNKLLGSPAGYVGYNDGYIFKQVLDNPYSIILFDEIEKANPKVINLLLQILDEGYIVGNDNEKISFNNTTIFLTSNVAVKNSVGFASNTSDNEYLNREIISRIDKVINYNPVNKETAKKYINIKNKNVDEEKVIAISNYQKYGFRELDRCIKAVESNIKIY